MNPKKKKTRKVKAYLVLTDGDFMEWGASDRRVAIYETLERAEERVSYSPDFLRIVRCTITYEV